MRTKHSDEFNVYPAMNGYDLGIANPFNTYGDPGIRNRIFLHDCENGYYDFISDIRSDMHCDSDFSMKTVSSTSDYHQARQSSNSHSLDGSVGGGMLQNPKLFLIQ